MVEEPDGAVTISRQPPGLVPSHPIAFIGEPLRGPHPGRNIRPRDHRPATDTSRISWLRGSASATFQIVSYLTRGRDSRAFCCKCSKLRKSIYNLAKHRAFRAWRWGEGVTAGLRVARPLDILGCETLEPWSRTTATQPAGFQSPIVLPSGSANQANVPDGIVTGGTSVLPPSDSALASAAGISSTWT